MVYGGSGVVGDDGSGVVGDDGSGVVGNDGSGDSDVGGSDWLSESADPVLDLLSNSYSDFDIFLYKG